MNIHIRNTLISDKAFNAIPVERQEKIKALVTEYQGLGYVSAWDIGRDQWARTSKKQADRMNKTRLRVFRIEDEVNELLKTDEQLAKEQVQAKAKELANRRQYLENRIEQLKSFCFRKLESKRDNGTKREYQELINELKSLV
jgi:hypothetical protein